MKPSILLLCALLIASNGWWIYRTVDQGVTNTYREQERYEVANRVVALSALATEAVAGKPKSEAEATLRRLFPDEEPFEKEGVLHTLWISLPLSKEGRVTGVAIDDATRETAKPVPERARQAGVAKP